MSFAKLKSAAPICYIELYGTLSTESGIDTLATDASKLTIVTTNGVLCASGTAVTRLLL